MRPTNTLTNQVTNSSNSSSLHSGPIVARENRRQTDEFTVSQGTFRLSEKRSLELLKVSFGQRTFDAEGLETSGPYFSRRISWPGTAGSGVTIGRGYDMGLRSAQQIINELTQAGLDYSQAQFLSRAAFKRGLPAKEFVDTFRHIAPEISLEVQKELFENVTTPQMIADIKRIFSKPDVIKTYGEASWDALSEGAREIVFDLRYRRGDYTPRTRRDLQPLLVNADDEGLRVLINDTGYWLARGVPVGRIKERQRMMMNPT